MSARPLLFHRSVPPVCYRAGRDDFLRIKPRSDDRAGRSRRSLLSVPPLRIAAAIPMRLCATPAHARRLIAPGPDRTCLRGCPLEHARPAVALIVPRPSWPTRSRVRPTTRRALPGSEAGGRAALSAAAGDQPAGERRRCGCTGPGGMPPGHYRTVMRLSGPA